MVTIAAGRRALPVRVWRRDPLGQVLRRRAVRMPDGSLEVCPFCRSHAGNPKVVFDDYLEAELAAAEMEVLPGARGRIKTHRCRVWCGVWHLTGSEANMTP